MVGRQVVGERMGKVMALQTKGSVEVLGGDWMEGGLGVEEGMKEGGKVAWEVVGCTVVECGG